MHDDDNWEVITDRHGRKVRVLKDGGVARVRFRDAQADSERAALRGCRPGYRVLLDGSGRAQRRPQVDAAYASAEHEMVNAWRDPPRGLGRLRDGNGNGSNGFSGRFGESGREGDQCMINGAPGHLEQRNGRLVCVPDRDDDSDDDVFADATRRRKYVTRDPRGRVESETEETEEEAADSAFNDAQIDAEQQRELAYQDYAKSISRAWKRG
jgi:hypothetical protein